MMMMKFILQKEVSRECDHNHDCESCTTHVCSDTILVSKQVSQEEYVATLLQVIIECEEKVELVGDDLRGEFGVLRYMDKAKTQIRKIELEECPDSTFVFII